MVQTSLLSGWGQFPKMPCSLIRPRSEQDMQRAVEQPSLIPRGNGRAYGDAALNPRGVVSSLQTDRLRSFDPESGILVCEAGLLLADLIAFALPRGFFPPVVPGTKFVTVGGMIAADIHGKNHHGAGTFCRHVVSLSLLTADGTIQRCGPDENAALFHATCGGMGLTGMILEASIRLVPVETAYLRQETLRAASLDEAMALCEVSSGWRYGVAWIDCVARGRRLGRSIIYRAEHATRGEVGGDPFMVPPRPIRRIPIDFPAWTLNRWSVSAFNTLYYARARVGTAIVDYDRYFFPLDALLGWNRLYGRPGFVQYQCVIPRAESPVALRRLLEKLSGAGSSSFLSVLKLCGPEAPGLLSFPLEGYTLALDFPANTANFNLMLELDRIVLEHGGRLYLAKDSRMSATLFRQTYPRLASFQAVRRTIDPARKFSSLLSERLDL